MWLKIWKKQNYANGNSIAFASELLKNLEEMVPSLAVVESESCQNNHPSPIVRIEILNITNNTIIIRIYNK